MCNILVILHLFIKKNSVRYKVDFFISLSCYIYSSVIYNTYNAHYKIDLLENIFYILL